jgi:hypothetical protein
LILAAQGNAAFNIADAQAWNTFSPAGFVD